MSSDKKRKIRTLKLTVITARYILPILLSFAMAAVTFIPCLQYSTVEGTNDVMSGYELFMSSWNTVRSYLFSGGEKDATQESFATVLLVLLIAFALLFTVGAVFSAVHAIFAFRYMASPDDGTDSARMWFVTLVPNRIVASVIYGATLPVLFLSRIVIPLFDGMNVDVLLNVKGIEPWVFGIIFYCAVIALTVVSSYFEKELSMDVFKRRIPAVRVIERSDAMREDEPVTEGYSEERQKEKEEAAELIRKMLRDNDKE